MTLNIAKAELLNNKCSCSFTTWQTTESLITGQQKKQAPN